MAIVLKRVYDPASADDGARVLVDRLWPRGLAKTAAALDAWLKDLAPSDDLGKWYHEHPQQWAKFRQNYLKELSGEAAGEALRQLYALRNQHSQLTLLFASKNIERNNAVVLKQLVDGERKPPTGTGPIRSAAGKRAKAAQRR
jgi:uncharacterized protein YeaO (DUF488 family)